MHECAATEGGGSILVCNDLSDRDRSACVSYATAYELHNGEAFIEIRSRVRKRQLCKHANVCTLPVLRCILYLLFLSAPRPARVAL